MKNTLRVQLRACHEKTDFVKYPSQILNLAENIHFTVDTERAIQERTLERQKVRPMLRAPPPPRARRSQPESGGAVLGGGGGAVV